MLTIRLPAILCNWQAQQLCRSYDGIYRYEFYLSLSPPLNVIEITPNALIIMV